MSNAASPEPEAGPPATILVVEDEEAIRMILRTALEMRGYRVLTAEDAAAGLRASKAHEGRIDLIITDMLMPGMNGSDLVRVLLPDRPDVHVIYVSGYLGSEVDLPPLPTGQTVFLPKPFTPRELIEVV